MLHFIGYRVFATLNSSGPEEHERKRESALRLEFITLVPAADRLWACELTLQRQHTDQGCKLECCLVLLRQSHFDFSGTGEPQPAGAKELADFEIDVAGVKVEPRAPGRGVACGAAPAMSAVTPAPRSVPAGRRPARPAPRAA